MNTLSEIITFVALQDDTTQDTVILRWHLKLLTV
jgi:hypothetical protein